MSVVGPIERRFLSMDVLDEINDMLCHIWLNDPAPFEELDVWEERERLKCN